MYLSNSFVYLFVSIPRVFAQMKITTPSKVVLGNSEQLIENVLFDIKLPKLKQYHLANGNTVAEVGDSSDVSQTLFIIKWKLFCMSNLLTQDF